VEFGHALMQMGVQIPQGEEIPPEIENQIAVAAAHAAQVLQPEAEEIPEDEGPDPKTVEAARRGALEEEKARADIRRRDSLSQAEIDRKNAELEAGLHRQAADQEARLLREFVSDQAKKALREQPGDALPPGN